MRERLQGPGRSLAHLNRRTVPANVRNFSSKVDCSSTGGLCGTELAPRVHLPPLMTVARKFSLYQCVHVKTRSGKEHRTFYIATSIEAYLVVSRAAFPEIRKFIVLPDRS